jgi:hypothetical protein
MREPLEGDARDPSDSLAFHSSSASLDHFHWLQITPGGQLAQIQEFPQGFQASSAPILDIAFSLPKETWAAQGVWNPLKAQQ